MMWSVAHSRFALMYARRSPESAYGNLGYVAIYRSANRDADSGSTGDYRMDLRVRKNIT
jgi:hypothetical protein